MRSKRAVSVFYSGRVANVGSNASNSLNAGPFTLNANNSSSNRNRNHGSQLAVSRNRRNRPAQSGKYATHKSLVAFSETLGRCTAAQRV